MKTALYITAFALVFVLGVCVGQLPVWVERMCGRAYNPAEAKDLSELRRMTFSLAPLVSAIHKYQAEHHRTPSLSELSNGGLLPAHFKETWFDSFPQATYLSEGKDMDFTLYVKLGWDPSLQFLPLDGRWVYRSGTGNDDVGID